MSCPKGQIRRSSYTRKAHPRKNYKRSDGTHVKHSYVDRTRVPSTCVPDKGAPGKTPSQKRVLPSVGKEKSLRRYGYSTKKSESKRHNALNKASEKYHPLDVLRRLNLIANYTAEPDVEKVLRRDVRYMSKKYKQYKNKSNSRKGKKQSKSKKKGSRKSKSSSKRKRRH